ncbi:MAG: RNase adapter RapZ [Clostridia bacterium]|nr:RNase adapter RapZ [Clostridia bacterium]
MEFIIVTGMSGAGKSRAIDAMEDIGFYCVDNIPPALIPIFYDMYSKSEGMPPKVAVVCDTRGGELFKAFFDATETLKDQKREYKILFLDCDDAVLAHRYQETRRKHPLAESFKGSLQNAIMLEREMLRPVKERADYIIDTSALRPQYMKEQVTKLFLDSKEQSLYVHCMSFGFRHGLPPEADLVFDVRCLPNPFYIDELRHQTGLDKPVYEYVMGQPEAEEFRTKLTEMIDFLLPMYIREGKSQLVIAMGCTGGHHRSVAFAQYMYNHLADKHIKTTITHRDITK